MRRLADILDDDPRQDRRERCGLSDPHLTDRDATLDERLDEQDRLADIAGLPFFGVHVEQPSERERRLHRAGERDARLALYPDRRVDVTNLGRRAA